MPHHKKVMPRGKRPPRAAAAVSAAINNVLLGKSNVGPALASAATPAIVAPAVAGPSSAPFFAPAHPRRNLGRPRPAGGIGVKNMQAFHRRNRDIKIKKLLPQPKTINVKKNGVIVRKMVVCRRALFPGRRARIY